MTKPRAAVAAAGLLSLACTHGTNVRLALDAVAAEVSLQPENASDWRVLLRTREPVAQLRFARNPDDSRARRWRVEEGFEIAHEDGADFLRRTDRAAFREASLLVPARYVPLPKDYAPFSPFSDGGVLIYSGQFHACAGESECPDDCRWQIEVLPSPGAHVVVQGEVHASAVTFSDFGDGTNIYVGRTIPLDSSHFIAVIDSGLPAEVKDVLYRMLPPLMNTFAQRLGPLVAKPMLFASLDPNPPKGSGHSNQGGTLPQQIFMHLYGEEWSKNVAPKLDGFFAWFFAHEAAHLFQAVEGVAAYHTDQSWIHEGAAEAFAALTITRLGIATHDYVRGRVEEAVSQCAGGLEALGERPLNASAEAGAFANYYACGLLVHLAIDSEVRRTSKGARDLFDVWALFLSRAKDGAKWDQQTFLGAATEVGAERSSQLALALATSPQSEVERFLRAGLREAGVVIAGP